VEHLQKGKDLRWRKILVGRDIGRRRTAARVIIEDVQIEAVTGGRHHYMCAGGLGAKYANQVSLT
jgi:hypothetical protein